MREDLDVPRQLPARRNSVTNTEADACQLGFACTSRRGGCVILLVVEIPGANAPRTGRIANTNAPSGTSIGTIVSVRSGDARFIEVDEVSGQREAGEVNLTANSPNIRVFTSLSTAICVFVGAVQTSKGQPTRRFRQTYQHI